MNFFVIRFTHKSGSREVVFVLVFFLSMASASTTVVSTGNIRICLCGNDVKTKISFQKCFFTVLTKINKCLIEYRHTEMKFISFFTNLHLNLFNKFENLDPVGRAINFFITNNMTVSYSNIVNLLAPSKKVLCIDATQQYLTDQKR